MRKNCNFVSVKRPYYSLANRERIGRAKKGTRDLLIPKDSGTRHQSDLKRNQSRIRSLRNRDTRDFLGNTDACGPVGQPWAQIPSERGWPGYQLGAISDWQK